MGGSQWKGKRKIKKLPKVGFVPKVASLHHHNTTKSCIPTPTHNTTKLRGV